MSRYDNDYEDYKEENQSYWRDNIVGRRAVVAQAYEIKNVNEIENSMAYGIDITKKVKSAATLMDEALKKSKKAGLKIKNEFVVIKPYYPEEYLKRCSNAFLFDDVVFSALNRLSFFTFGTGEDIRSILYPVSTKQLKSEMEAKKELELVEVIRQGMDKAGVIIDNHLKPQEIQDFENFINYTDKNCRLIDHLRQNQISAHVFGRSASYIEYSTEYNKSLKLPADTPIGLKPMKSQYLGNVTVDPVTWRINAVQYKDPTLTFDEKRLVDIGVAEQGRKEKDKFELQYIPVDDVLYFVKNNYNMMKEEDDQYFGHSTFQCIMAQTEENRRLKQIVIPAINQGHWAGSGYWYFPNWSESMMRRFFGSIKPGAHVGIPDERIKFQEAKLTYDYAGLINLQNELKKQILSVFGMPSFLMNFEDVTNRATSDTVIMAFNESMIKSERAWISSILDLQWYPKLFKLYYPNDEFLHIKMKMKMEFESISFETFLEKAVAVANLVEKGVITKAEGRALLDFPDVMPSPEGPTTTQPGTQPPPALNAPPPPTNMVQEFMQQKQALNNQQKQAQVVP